MGEMADYVIDSCIEQWAEEASDIDNLTRQLTNSELVAFTTGARLPLIVGIRNYYAAHERLSAKQRYCLARWIIEHDRSIT